MNSNEAQEFGIVTLEVEGYSLNHMRQALRLHRQNSAAANDQRVFHVVEVPDGVNVQDLPGFVSVLDFGSWGWASVPDVPRLLGQCETFLLVRKITPRPDHWMAIYRRSMPLDDPLGEISDVAVPLASFNASEVPQASWQNIRAMRSSELGRRYPLMARL